MDEVIKTRLLVLFEEAGRRLMFDFVLLVLTRIVDVRVGADNPDDLLRADNVKDRLSDLITPRYFFHVLTMTNLGCPNGDQRMTITTKCPRLEIS